MMQPRLISSPGRRLTGGVSAIVLGVAASVSPVSPVFGQEDTDALAAADESRTEGILDEVEFASDDMVFDPATNIVTFRGNVAFFNGGYALHADRVTYDRNSGIVRAAGHVVIDEPGGNRLLLDEAELDDQLREGFITNVRLILSDDSRMAALSGQRTDGRKTTLNRAVYSPCNLCEDKPNNRPLWQIKAVKITHDQEKKRIYYQDAVLEMLGIPILWLPFLSHPDPTVQRESGFLTPEIQTRKELGVTLSLPYHFAFSPSSDATLTPIITTKESLVLAGEYRKHFGFGQAKIEGSATYTDASDINNIPTGTREMRGHLFSDGVFQHGQNWRSKYRFQWAGDDTYLRRYGFSKLDTLTSEYQAEGFYGRSYANIRAQWFKGLRVEDDQGLSGFALPMMEYDYVSAPDRRGGVFRANVNTLALNRTDGIDTQRVSARGSWEIPYTTSLGQRLRLGAGVRGDVYRITDADRPDIPAFAGQDGVDGRFLPHLSASASWPLIRHGGEGYQVLEPIVTIVAALDGGNPATISNEDSRTFELNDANIFSENRFPGLDRWEGGTRVSYGVKWGYYSGKLSSEVLIGQSVRFDDSAVTFPQGSGISGNFSDLVGRWDISVEGLIELSHRFRLDKDNLAIRRNEIDASVGNSDYRVTIGYFQLNRNREDEGLEDREEVRATGEFKLQRHWRLFGDITQDLTGGRRGVAHGVGLLYRDECLEFSLAWHRSFTEDRDIVPGSSIRFRIRLKHLG